MSKQHPRSTFESDPAGGDIVSVRRASPRSLLYFCEFCSTLHHHKDTGHSDGRSSVRFGSKCPKHPESYRLFIEDSQPGRLSYSEKSILSRALSRASTALDRAQEIDAPVLLRLVGDISSKIDQACPPASKVLNSCCLGCTERDGLALRCPRIPKLSTGQLTAKRGCPDFKHDDAQQKQTEELVALAHRIGKQVLYQSPRMVQLALLFPALAYYLAESRPDLIPAVDEGQKMKAIAEQAGVPMLLRKLPAEASITLLENPAIFQWPDLLSNRLPDDPDDLRSWALICVTEMAQTGLEWLVYRAAEILEAGELVAGRAFASDVNDWLTQHPDITLTRTDTPASVERRMEAWHVELAVKRTGGDYPLPLAPVAALEIEETQYKFTHLESRLAVVEEGRRMRHCIASYADNARQRQCLIFSLRKADESSVLTLTTSGQYPYELLQGSGYRNAVPTAFQARCARTLIDELNKAAERC